MSIAKKLGISEELFSLVMDALRRGLVQLDDIGEQFNPFVLVEGGEKPMFQRFVAPEPDQALKAAQVLIGRMPAENVRYALVFDGQIEVDEEGQDALIVEAGERGSEQGIAIAMRYQSTNDSGFEQVGNPMEVGRFKNYFA